MGLRGNRFRFVRHAETEWNEKQLCQGIKDIPLNAKGRDKSFEFGRLLKPIPIQTICSSPLVRALETAQIIQSFHPACTIQIIEELKERDWGQLEGISSQEMYHIEEQEESDAQFIPGFSIESRLALKQRIAKGLNKAFDLDANPFIVSHGRVFVSLCEILQIPPIRQIPNLALIEFHRTDLGWKYTIARPNG